MKVCKICQLELSVESYSHTKGYLRTACKKCEYLAYSKPWKQKNRKPRKPVTVKEPKAPRKIPVSEVEYRRAYYQLKKTDPIWRAARNLRKRLKKQLDKGFRNGPTIAMLGCTILEFRDYIAKQFTEGMTWDNYGEWHLDHIKPICSYDLTDTEQVALINHYSNLRPLWAVDNIAKSLEDSKQKYVR